MNGKPARRNKLKGLVAFALLLGAGLGMDGAAARAAVAASGETPVAIIINDGTEWWRAARRNGTWLVGPAPEKYFDGRDNNEYALTRSDMALIDACFTGKPCLPLSGVGEAEPVAAGQPQARRADAARIIRRLSEDIFIAYDYAGPNRGRAIDARTGTLNAPLIETVAMAVGTQSESIISATCPSADACDIFATDLRGKNKRLLAHLALRIVDLQARDGVVYGLAKAPGTKWHMPHPFMEMAGHPVSYEDWSVVEISMANGAVKTQLLLSDLRNASGEFPHKWSAQQAAPGASGP